MTLTDLKNKKIAVVGMGVNNKHLAEYLTRHDVTFDVVENWTDLSELEKQLTSYEIIFRTPGLPFLSAPIQAAKSAGVVVSSQTKLFFDLCPAPIIGVTGTKGKGTTSSLITKILERNHRTVWLGGNIGRDPFEFLEQITPTDYVVLELSSFQIQDLEKSPHVAVVLSINPDHLDHHMSMEEYVQAKLQLIKYQKPTDYAILYKGLPSVFQTTGEGFKIFFDAGDGAGLKTKLLGPRNRENIGAALMVCEALNLPMDNTIDAIAEFEPLPHRLATVAQKNGITYIDDSFSTNVESTMGAIEAVESDLVLILGGVDKGFGFEELGEKIKASLQVKAVVVIGSVTDKIVKALTDFTGKILTGSKNMKEIVAQANSVATTGSTVLLSPGTASFDMFKNATDRAEQFIEVVNSL